MFFKHVHTHSFTPIFTFMHTVIYSHTFPPVHLLSTYTHTHTHRVRSDNLFVQM